MGEPFGAQAFGVTPDIMTMAKAITNGVVPSRSCSFKRAHIYDTMVDAAPKGAIEFFHGYTYSGIPCAVAAGSSNAGYNRKRKFISIDPKICLLTFLDGLFSLKGY